MSVVDCDCECEGEEYYARASAFDHETDSWGVTKRAAVAEALRKLARVLADAEGRDEERRRTVAFLIKLGLRLTAAGIEAGEHWGDENGRTL